ncbi:MAG: hypothetical protein JJ900_15710 [Rhodospirillales bacterium]|nr:hypothetical protein [Rhodospirillales bacterium]MBO6788294.1 hypothetical protein [Rhodospirillales bacterium]
MSDTIISNLVADLKAATVGIDDPAAAIERATPIIEKMATDLSWVKPAYYQCDDDQGFGITILNEEPDHALLVEAICWLPGRGVAPHDHQTWGIVVGIDGVEVNVDWKRKDDGSKPGFADLERDRETDVTRGVVCSFMPDDIHGVRNDGDVPSLSLHVYGITPSTLDRSEFDPVNKTQKPCPQRKRVLADA